MCALAFVLRILMYLALHIPESQGYLLADRLGDVCWVIAIRARRAVTWNLCHLYSQTQNSPVVRTASVRVFRNLVRGYFDLVKLAHMSDEELSSKVDVDWVQLSVLKGYVQGRQGLIFVSFHHETMEAFLQVQACWGLALTCLGERFTPHAAFEMAHDLRHRRGLRLSYADNGPQAIKTVIAALRDGGAILLFMDRNIKGEGIRVQLDYGETIIPAAMAKLALRHDSPIVFVRTRKDPNGRYVVQLSKVFDPKTPSEAPLTIPDLTQAVAQVIVAQIASAPEQWTLLQPFWVNSSSPMME